MKNMKYKNATITCIGLMVLTLTGCMSSNQPSFEPTTHRNKITVAETVERLELYTGPAGLHLSARDQDAVVDFLSQYANTAEGPLYINVPANGAGNHGVRQAQTIIRSHLGRMGMSGAAVQTGQYPARMGAPAPVIVSYRRLAVEPINCQQGANLTHTFNNQPYRNYGCAQTANLAALIDNPRQLLAPNPIDNAQAIRRMTVMEKYNAGENTATPRPEGQEVAAGNKDSGGGGG